MGDLKGAGRDDLAGCADTAICGAGDPRIFLPPLFLMGWAGASVSERLAGILVSAAKILAGPAANSDA